MKTVTLSSCVMRCQTVPPYMQAAVRRQLPEPPFPKVEVKSSAGGAEVLPALPGTPEHDKYRADLTKYRRMLAVSMESFILDYGCVDWQLPGSDEWHTGPPSGWYVPGQLREYGIEPATTEQGIRVQYIQFVLIQTEEDASLIENILYATKELTKAEVLAALAPFDLKEAIDLWKLYREVVT